jgi:hypothetical protein
MGIELEMLWPFDADPFETETMIGREGFRISLGVERNLREQFRAHCVERVN